MCNYGFFFFLNLPLCSKRCICRGKKKKKDNTKKWVPAIRTTASSLLLWTAFFTLPRVTICTALSASQITSWNVWNPRRPCQTRHLKAAKVKFFPQQNGREGRHPRSSQVFPTQATVLPQGLLDQMGPGVLGSLALAALLIHGNNTTSLGCKMSPNDTTFPNRSRQNKKQDTRLASEG